MLLTDLIQAEAECCSPAARELLDRLCAGDEERFRQFVLRHGVTMRRVAAMVTGNSTLAEDAVQETWLAVMKGLPGFAGRSSFRTWVFRILVNRARTLASREWRSIPVSQLPAPSQAADPLAHRFDHPEHPGHWTIMPLPEWGRSPEQDVLNGEVRDLVAKAIAVLPTAQREVITLRDVEGWPAAEVCNVCGLSEVHQRVLLHRARTRVRAALEAWYLERRR